MTQKCDLEGTGQTADLNYQSMPCRLGNLPSPRSRISWPA